MKKYILTTDRPTDDRRPTDLLLGPYWGNFKWPYLCEGSSDPLHIWFYGGVFWVGKSNGAISGFAKSKIAARPKSWKIQMTSGVTTDPADPAMRGGEGRGPWGAQKLWHEFFFTENFREQMRTFAAMSKLACTY